MSLNQHDCTHRVAPPIPSPVTLLTYFRSSSNAMADAVGFSDSSPHTFFGTSGRLVKYLSNTLSVFQRPTSKICERIVYCHGAIFLIVRRRNGCFPWRCLQRRRSAGRVQEECGREETKSNGRKTKKKTTCPFPSFCAPADVAADLTCLATIAQRAEAGVLGKRMFPLECAAAQICREAGARVATNVWVRDMERRVQRFGRAEVGSGCRWFELKARGTAGN